MKMRKKKKILLKLQDIRNQLGIYLLNLIFRLIISLNNFLFTQFNKLSDLPKFVFGPNEVMMRLGWNFNGRRRKVFASKNDKNLTVLG